MSLAHARGRNGRPIRLPGEAPFACADLAPLEGVAFTLPCEHAWLLEGRDAPHAYLDAAAEAWEAHPDWMDFLSLDSPGYDLKRAARDVYLHHWREWLDAARVMDVGCGVGRLTMPFLDRGATVWGVDGDLRSLQRCAWHAARRPGRLDLRWTSTARLPEVGELDAIVACESLCYVPDLEGALAACAARLRPGGALLISMEAEHGWAVAPDAPQDALHLALEGGVVDLPGERWVRTVSAEALRDLLASAGLDPVRVVATHYVVDGPLEGVMPTELTEEALLAAEARCRAHPVWAPLNRIWTAAAIRR